MADDRDLDEIAKNATDDFYELLGVAFEATENDIKSAYRKASIKAHPDKNPDDPTAADRFIRLGVARDILMSVTLKALYDKQRQRKRERELQNSLLDGKRRTMIADLERREREARQGEKRKREEMTEAEKREAQKEAEIQRLVADVKRRRAEHAEKLKKQREEEEALFAGSNVDTSAKPQAAGQSTELDRTIKLQFPREGETAGWDKEKVSQMFGKYGKVDMVVMGKDKKTKVPGEKHRKLTATVFVVFPRLDQAHTAVVDGKRDYPLLTSVDWANGEPVIKPSTTSESSNGLSLQEATMMRLKQAAKREQQASAPSTPVATPNKAPASFIGSLGKSAGTPNTPKFAFSPSTNKGQTPMQHREAERKRLEEEIRRQDAAEDAEAAAA